MTLTTDQLTAARLYLADPGSSAIQSILIQNATGGTWTISYNSQTTSALDFDAGANEVENALCALSNVGVGNLSVNNTYPYTVYFDGVLGTVAQVMLTVDASHLTGTTTPTATVSKVAAGGVQAFSDSELNLLYTNANDNFWLMLAYAFRALQADMSRLSDYIAGQSSDKASQRYAHIREMAELYTEWAQSDRQVQIASMVPEPPRLRAVPWRSGSAATGLAYQPPYGRYRRGWGGW